MGGRVRLQSLVLRQLFVAAESQVHQRHVQDEGRVRRGLKDGTCEFCFDGDGVPDDYRTEWRYNFPFDEDVNSFAVDTRIQLEFATGPLDHQLLAGIDYRKYDNDQSFGFGLAPPIDLFNPVYGADIVTPPMNPYVDQVQKQTGFYVQDQIKWDRLIVTLSGRQDSVDNDNFGTETDDDEFTYRAGVNYVFQNGFAPYIQYATSFQPVYGADFLGKRSPSLRPASRSRVASSGTAAISTRTTSCSLLLRSTRSSRTRCWSRSGPRCTRSPRSRLAKRTSRASSSNSSRASRSACR